MDPSAPKRPIKIFLVDDHELIRDGLKARLSNDPLLQVVGEASNGLDAVAQVPAHRPDIVLMDINLPDITGLETTKRLLSRPATFKIIILSVHEEREYIEQAVNEGAKGYILKDARVEELVTAIRRVDNGEYYFSAKATLTLATPAADAKQPVDTRGLSKREIEILQHVANGRTNKEIAQLENISVRTAETHRHNIREKLGAKNTADLTRVAMSLGMI